MTQLSVPSQPTSLSAPAPAAGHASIGAAADAAPDFAALLDAQIALPAKDGPATEIIAALLPAEAPQAAGSADMASGNPPTAPDLIALLPALAGQMPVTTSEAPAEPVGPETAPAALPPALAAAADTAGQLAAAVHAPAATAPRNAALGATQAEAAVPIVAQIAVDGAAAPARAQADRPGADVALPGGLPDGRVETKAPLPLAAADQAAALAGAAGAATHAHQAGQTGTAPATLRIDTPVGSRGWDAEVGQKVVLMVNRMESRAELTLTPPQLGRIEVTISVNGDQTSAAFVSASPAAREALEQALPRLRDMLAEAGIALGQTSVNAESPRRDGEGPSTRTPGGSRAAPAPTAAAGSGPWLRRGEGLIDTFA